MHLRRCLDDGRQKSRSNSQTLSTRRSSIFFHSVLDEQQRQIKRVNFQYADPDTMLARYNPRKLKPGPNTVAGEDIFYIPNPAIGLWSTRDRFK